MSAAPVLSATWFPPRERTLATAIATTANYLGVAVSFAAGLSLVPAAPGGSSQVLTPEERASRSHEVATGSS